MAAEDAPRVPLTAIEPARDAARPTATGKRATAAKAPVIEKTPPRTSAPAPVSPAPAVVSPAPAPPIVAALPPTPTPATARSDTAKLKVEVIVYSEQRPLRWAFINGRKYVEGDTIDGARIEEILSNAVVLVEDGRRVPRATPVPWSPTYVSAASRIHGARGCRQKTIVRSALTNVTSRRSRPPRCRCRDPRPTRCARAPSWSRRRRAGGAD